MKNTKMFTRILAVSLAAVFMLSGCGVNGSSKTFATLDDQKISIGFANFVAHYQQASYDQIYVEFVGEDYWSQDLYGSGNDMETDIKAEIADVIKEMYVLDSHKDEYGVSVSAEEQSKIDEAVEKFYAANTKKALKEIGATKEYVREYLRLSLVSTKLTEAMKESFNPNYSMEDAAQKAITYMDVNYSTKYDDEGNEVEISSEDKAEITSAMEGFAKESPENLEAAAEALEYKTLSVTFGDDDSVTPDIVKNAVAELEVGQMSKLLDDGERYYIVRYDSEYDEEATKQHLEDMNLSVELEEYNKKVDEWKNSVSWTMDQDLWDQVKFDILFTAPADEENAEG